MSKLAISARYTWISTPLRNEKGSGVVSRTFAGKRLPTPFPPTTFDAAGKLLYGDPQVVERELVYVVVQNPSGQQDLLRPSEFQLRFGDALAKAR
jgi:hypothetical protein